MEGMAELLGILRILLLLYILIYRVGQDYFQRETASRGSENSKGPHTQSSGGQSQIGDRSAADSSTQFW